MRLAVMQPYVFPYMGYFQLVEAVDHFVFYDDVNFIKGGWVNRNRILLNGKDHYICIPCKKISSNKQINEIQFDASRPEFRKLKKCLFQSYRRAPYFDRIFPLVEKILQTPTRSIAVLAGQSVKEIAAYLEIKTEFHTSSEDFPKTREHDRTDRLIQLCRDTRSGHYINLIGGRKLYDRDYFRKNGIHLNFIRSLPVEYKQLGNKFVPWLSMIDVLMFNSIEEIRKMLKEYELV